MAWHGMAWHGMAYLFEAFQGGSTLQNPGSMPEWLMVVTCLYCSGKQLRASVNELFVVQVSPEDSSTPEPSHHPSPSPLPTPPMSTHRPHLSFEDMLRQQLGQQVTPSCLSQA